MPTATPELEVNGLCTILPQSECIRLQALCEPVELVMGTVLCESDQHYTHVYFPLTGFISLATTLTGHPPLEMGLIGCEGMLGATLALGVTRVPMRAIVQGSGSALRVSVAQYQQALYASPELRRVMRRYLYVLIMQLSHSLACIRFHEIEPRLARRLLMTHDRVRTDYLHLTHESLADALGVRRSGITIAAGSLQARGLIRYRRGEVMVLDRPGLEAASCECYATLIDDYDRDIGHAINAETT